MIVKYGGHLDFIGRSPPARRGLAAPGLPLFPRSWLGRR
jgi:hypothetical protein